MGAQFNDKNVVITGGLGFIGSTLALALFDRGANITIIDNMDALYGGNYFNISRIRDQIKILEVDANQIESYHAELDQADFVYHLAAQVSYIDSLSMPERDLEYNSISTLKILEYLRRNNRDAHVIFTSSRMIYGKIQTALVKETHPTNPLSLYGVHKLTSEKYLTMYFKDFGIKTTTLRITNPYGPRQQIKHNKYSLVGWFIKQAMDDKEIRIFGDGNQQRDYIYISDIVEGLVAVGSCTGCSGEVYNLGSGKSTTFKNMVETVVSTVGAGSIKYVEWPKDYEQVETGNFNVSMSKLFDVIKWQPEYSLEEGVKKTFDYYNIYRNHYE